MKINLAQLRQHLNQGLQSLYVITGDEPLLVDETCQYLTKLAKQESFTEKQAFVVTGKFKWAEVFFASQSLSLFSEKKIIQLQIPTGKPGREGAASLVEFSSELPADTLLLVCLPKLTASAQKAKWFTSLEKAGVVINIWPIKRAELPQWIAKRLQRHKLTASTQGLQLIANYCEGNLLAAKQAVERLSLLSNNTELADADIEASLSDSSHFDVYQLLPEIFGQHNQRSLNVLHNLHASNTEASLVLWMLTKELHNLVVLREAQQNQQPLNNLWKQLGIWPQRQGEYLQHLKHTSVAQYQQLLQLAYQCDCALKGMSAHDIWHELELLVTNFSNPKLLSLSQARLSA